MTDAGDVVLALLADRAEAATICPSEVARRLAADDGAAWRDMMPAVHAAVDRLVREDRVRLSWKGRGMPGRHGPYRIGRPPVMP